MAFVLLNVVVQYTKLPVAAISSVLIQDPVCDGEPVVVSADRRVRRVAGNGGSNQGIYLERRSDDEYSGIIQSIGAACLAGVGDGGDRDKQQPAVVNHHSGD